MAADSNVAPVIIKRKKIIAGGGHHGGAWKVAYADFVTAMMAFFLLMWLLSATTEKQRNGLADYFSPTIAISRMSSGGDGSFGGDNPFSEETLPKSGTGATSMNPTESNHSRGLDGQSEDANAETAEDEVFKEIEKLLKGRGGESMVADPLLQHIETRVTDEGLVVELYETEDARLFDRDGAPTELLEQLSGVILRVSDLVSNPLAIEGHVRSEPIVVARDRSWETSTDRAAVMRNLLSGQGMPNSRFDRVTAHADREPIRRNRMEFRNSRIEVIYLRRL
ncbi:flagellar motor protein MotB [Puniceibacterium sediminis]|uniref:Chemotaxis protein MotB n=1 Tax=Puniceibacterium sediminis TaxID=1608407 RepID=A0A238VS41_9RHOB|nr:flagellar motor protein MotB [Puniceibacterium sediminis]SNR37056.1 chemotaxis protein MotB [Puniceibacterium sediminis]